MNQFCLVLIAVCIESLVTIPYFGKKKKIGYPLINRAIFCENRAVNRLAQSIFGPRERLFESLTIITSLHIEQSLIP